MMRMGYRKGALLVCHFFSWGVYVDNPHIKKFALIQCAHNLSCRCRCRFEVNNTHVSLITFEDCAITLNLYLLAYSSRFLKAPDLFSV